MHGSHMSLWLDRMIKLIYIFFHFIFITRRSLCASRCTYSPYTFWIWRVSQNAIITLDSKILQLSWWNKFDTYCMQVASQSFHWSTRRRIAVPVACKRDQTCSTDMATYYHWGYNSLSMSSCPGIGGDLLAHWTDTAIGLAQTVQPLWLRLLISERSPEIISWEH